MMPVVRTSDATFSNLKVLSKWMETDTPSKTIDLLVEEALDRLGIESETNVLTEEGVLTTVPGLTHTKITSATVDGKSIQNPNWSKILLATVDAVGKTNRLTKEQLSNSLQINSTPEVFEESGYKFHEHLGLSIQGQSAQDAGREIERLANKFSVSIVVELYWRAKKGAERPDQHAKLILGTPH